MRKCAPPLVKHVRMQLIVKLLRACVTDSSVLVTTYFALLSLVFPRLRPSLPAGAPAPTAPFDAHRIFTYVHALTAAPLSVHSQSIIHHCYAEDRFRYTGSGTVHMIILVRP